MQTGEEVGIKLVRKRKEKEEEKVSAIEKDIPIQHHSSFLGSTSLSSLSFTLITLTAPKQ